MKKFSIVMNKDLEKLDIFVERLKKIEIEISLVSNFPWIYLDKVNGIRVTEKFEAEHGFTIGFLPIRPNQSFHFTDLKEIFKIIKKYASSTARI